MKKIISTLLLGVALTACQSQPELVGIDTTQTVPEEGQFIERADGRTRAKVHTDLAGAYYEVGRLAIALEETQIALKADPNYPPALNMQGLINVELRDNVGAEAAFKKGLQIAPQDPDLNHNYGWFLCRTGRETESTQWFMNAIKNPLYQNPARSYTQAARCLQTKSPQDALDFYERALRLEPANLGALLTYGEFQYQRGQYGEAQALFLRYNRLVKEPSPEALWLGLRIARKTGDRANEMSYETQLRRRFPNSPQTADLQRGAYN